MHPAFLNLATCTESDVAMLFAYGLTLYVMCYMNGCTHMGYLQAPILERGDTNRSKRTQN